MSKRKLLPWGGFLLSSIGILAILAGLLGVGRSTTTQPLTATPPSPTPEPLIPTRTPTPVVTATEAKVSTEPEIEKTRLTTGLTDTATLLPPINTTAPPSPTLLPTSVAAPPPTELWHGLPRWGVGLASGSISHYNVEPLRLGWYVDWRTQLDPPRPGGIEYVQMVRLQNGILHPNAETIAAIARANPGSLWLIGNEPDVKWQDNVEATTYAQLYHEAYTAIKSADPTAQVAIGGVSQPTPLRMRYLDVVLATYRDQFGTETPVDVWNVHNFILREERGSWGVDIPPGLSDDHGMLYEIDGSDNAEIFQRQIVDFRRWMAERGYQDRPLIVSEYGIPMPEDYGFSSERVVAFLRYTFDFFSTATDPALGYPGDGYRLVQRWCWYSLNAPDSYYPQGRLFDPSTGQMTAVGQGWVNYVNE